MLKFQKWLPSYNGPHFWSLCHHTRELTISNWVMRKYKLVSWLCGFRNMTSILMVITYLFFFVYDAHTCRDVFVQLRIIYFSLPLGECKIPWLIPGLLWQQSPSVSEVNWMWQVNHMAGLLNLIKGALTKLMVLDSRVLDIYFIEHTVETLYNMRSMKYYGVIGEF